MWKHAVSLGRAAIRQAPRRAPSTTFVTRPRLQCSAFCTSAGEPKPEESKVQPEQPKETVTGQAESHGFQAETAQLLQIVAKSLYKDKEVFLRELISNAADASEKRRYLERTGTEGMTSVADDEICITTDKENNTLTIADSGIGMSEQEVHANLGQIASSGTKAFLQNQGNAAGLDLIGQFGVGFYSVFMVSDDVQVFTRSAIGDQPAFNWSCQGAGGAYTVAPASNVGVGTKIVIKLNDESKEYADESFLKGIIKKYSNFVGTKVRVNGEVVNTLEPIWTLDKNKVTEEQHQEFYRFLTNAWDKPAQHLWYSADAPLSVKALFYIPGSDKEKIGMGRQEMGVNVYCRKVLIEAQCAAILPEWLRFVKGVVDSEDVPLNISRETMQDSALIRQLNKAVTARCIRWLNDIGKKEPEQYKTLFSEFGNYIKEGVCTDQANMKSLLPLLRFPSSHSEDALHSLDEYVSRMPEDQDTIYYLASSDRASAQSSPYFEVFKKKGYEVFFTNEDIDDYLMETVPEFEGKKIQNAQKSNIDLTESESSKLSKEEQDQFCAWLKVTLGDRVQAVRATTRLVDSPSIVVNHPSATMRKLSKIHNMPMMQTPELEVNTEHNIATLLNEVRQDNSQKELADQVAHQLLDNSLIAAGIFDDKDMVQRLNKILESYLFSNVKSPA